MGRDGEGGGNHGRQKSFCGAVGDARAQGGHRPPGNMEPGQGGAVGPSSESPQAREAQVDASSVPGGGAGSLFVGAPRWLHGSSPAVDGLRGPGMHHFPPLTELRCTTRGRGRHTDPFAQCCEEDHGAAPVWG
eukprot:gene9226-biopygen1656